MKALISTLIGIFAALIILLLVTCHKEKEEPETFEATIQVVDADTNEPIEGAKVRIRTTDDSCESATMTTDENGECTFDYSDPEAELTQAVATKEGYRRGEGRLVELSFFEDDVLVIPLKKKDRQAIIDESETLGGGGDLKITLLWEDPSIDLDLHVLEPNGFELKYTDTLDVQTGGYLDLDWRPSRDDPAHIGENIYWSNPPRGQYKVWVRYYGPPTGDPTECNVIIKLRNHEPEIFNLSCPTPERNYQVKTFSIP